MGISFEENVQIGKIPATPDFNLFDARVFVPQAYESIIASSRKSGFPISYIQEQDGMLVQNLIPIKKTENTQISSSSKSNLELHTETAFHPFKPDYIFLLCLRGDENAATTYSVADDFLSDLDEQTLQSLQEPNYLTSVDDSFKTGEEETIDLRLSVLRPAPRGGWEVTYDKYAMRGIDDESQRALDLLTKSITASLRSTVLKSGQMLTIDNSKTVHGRSSFIPRYDGTDRWLLRTLVVRNLPPQQHRSGSLITTSFRKTVSSFA